MNKEIFSTCFNIISARVNTLARAPLTLLVKRTILQLVTLWLTADEGVSLQPIRAGADHIVVTLHLTPCPWATWVGRARGASTSDEGIV